MIHQAFKSLALTVLSACCLTAIYAQTPVPYLQKQGTATQLIVEGKPFIILGGELGNSTASSLKDMEQVYAKLKGMHLNTVLVPAYWELIEPEEGKFDFSLVDGAIDMARKHELKMVFLWFGAWKNSMSCYAPLWVKENYKKYPRAVTEAGQTLEMINAFNKNNLEVDKRAFRRFMSHLAEKDKDRQTVIMVQLENEIGMIGSARDHSKEANKAFDAQVPEQLTAYLLTNKTTLRSQLRERWEKNGSRTQGKWTEVFGAGLETDEIFMAWHYALFVQALAQTGKEAYPLPLFLNAALNSRGRKAGEYPSAGPLAHLLDIWRAAAPSIDFLAPDIYDPVFTEWCAQYQVNGNPLFIPEIRLSAANAVQALYAIGEHDALGFSPFSIEKAGDAKDYPLSRSYEILHQLLPLLKEKQGKGLSNGIWLNKENKERSIERNGYVFTFRHDHTLSWSSPKDENNWPETGAILIELSHKEYLVAGSGVVLTFGNTKKDGSITGIGFIDEVAIHGKDILPLRRLNGDENHQGRHLRIPVGAWNIQYVRLYDYE